MSVTMAHTNLLTCTNATHGLPPPHQPCCPSVKALVSAVGPSHLWAAAHKAGQSRQQLGNQARLTAESTGRAIRRAVHLPGVSVGSNCQSVRQKRMVQRRQNTIVVERGPSGLKGKWTEGAKACNEEEVSGNTANERNQGTGNIMGCGLHHLQVRRVK